MKGASNIKLNTSPIKILTITSLYLLRLCKILTITVNIPPNKA